MTIADPYDELKEQGAAAKKRLEEDSAGARMAVLKDDGLYRHLRFELPRASWGGFQIITWPGTLVIDGGLGHWSFQRQDDMFALLRTTTDPVYWEQKFSLGSKQKAVVYAPERAEAHIREAVRDRHPDLVDDIEESVFSRWSGESIETEAGMRAALARYEVALGTVDAEQPLFDVHEWHLTRYDDWFLLACHSMHWAVRQYDAALIPAC
ncbi:hypothetical protein ACIP6P_26875 [Streptomyces sp. NPDC088729]|uniref:hypothetical protein n=1 Tax=Streptomyces sp. NPDC088729 TaxID=3365876 RepID=UPI0038297D16